MRCSHHGGSGCAADRKMGVSVREMSGSTRQKWHGEKNASIEEKIELHHPVRHVIGTFALALYFEGGRWRIGDLRNYFYIPSCSTARSDEALFNLNALNLDLSPWAKVLGDEGVSRVITLQTRLQCVIARQRVLFTWPAWTWFGACERSADQWQGGGGRRGESGRNLARGERHAAFLSQSELDHSLGEKRPPAFCRLWIDCDCLWYKGTRVQVMTVCFWQTPPSSSDIASCSTIWFRKTVAMATTQVDWHPAFGGGLHGLLRFSRSCGERFILCEPLMEHKWMNILIQLKISDDGFVWYGWLCNSHCKLTFHGPIFVPLTFSVGVDLATKTSASFPKVKDTCSLVTSNFL